MIAASPVEAIAGAKYCVSCGAELTRFSRSCPHVAICLGCEARALEDAPAYLGD